jgi:hypothetical protein
MKSETTKKLPLEGHNRRQKFGFIATTQKPNNSPLSGKACPFHIRRK